MDIKFNDMSALERLNYAMQEMTKLRNKNILEDSLITFNPESFDSKEVNETISSLVGNIDGLMRSNISFLISLKNFFVRRPLPGGVIVSELSDFPIFNRDSNKVIYQFKKANDYLETLVDLMNKNQGMLSEINFSVYKKLYEKQKKLIQNANMLFERARFDEPTRTVGIVGPRVPDVSEIISSIYEETAKTDNFLSQIQRMSPYGITGKGVKYYDM